MIADVRGRIDGGKVWLVGTSTGTMSAASIAARLPRIAPPTKDNLRRPDGIVLTATQSNVVKGVCGRTVFNAQLSAVNVPALVVLIWRTPASAVRPNSLPRWSPR